MGGHKSITGTSYEVIVPPPTPDYIVTGVIAPDATGNYWLTGIHAGKNYYRRTDNLWFLFWAPGEPGWAISPELGVVEDFWAKIDPEIIGLYDPRGSYSGVATVSAGS